MAWHKHNFYSIIDSCYITCLDHILSSVHEHTEHFSTWGYSSNIIIYCIHVLMLTSQSTVYHMFHTQHTFLFFDACLNMI